MSGKPRICLVLGAGGLRGRASLGVLRRLRQERIPIDSIIGVSAGAIIAAYHAGIGWPVETCIAQVSQLTSPMLLAYAASRSRGAVLSRIGSRYAGRIAQWLRELDAGTFESLHHGVSKLGLLSFDCVSRRPVLFATGLDNDGVSLALAARGSAAMPVLFPPLRVAGRTREYLLSDGGVADPLPVPRALASPFDADFVIAVDVCRNPRVGARLMSGPLRDRVALVRPLVSLAGTILSRRGSTNRLVAAGERALTDEALARARSWLGEA